MNVTVSLFVTNMIVTYREVKTLLSSYLVSSPSSLQILMSVQTDLSSVIVNPLVSTCPAGTTVSVVMDTMTTACFLPMGSRV